MLTHGWMFHLGKKEKSKKPLGTTESKPGKTSDPAGETGDHAGRWRGGCWPWGLLLCASPTVQQRVGICSRASPAPGSRLCAAHGTEEPFLSASSFQIHRKKVNPKSFRAHQKAGRQLGKEGRPSRAAPQEGTTASQSQRRQERRSAKQRAMLRPYRVILLLELGSCSLNCNAGISWGFILLCFCRQSRPGAAGGARGLGWAEGSFT